VLRRSKCGPAVDWWAVGIVVYEMMVGEHPFKLPRTAPYRDKILHNSVRYPRSLTRNAVSILQGVSLFNTKSEAFRSELQFLEFGVFPHLVTLYSHRVNIKKMCF
jgi:serine/threonine protein kinase